MGFKKNLILFSSLVMIVALTALATVLYMTREVTNLEEEKNKLLVEFDKLELAALKQEQALQDSVLEHSSAIPRLEKDLERITGKIRTARTKLTELEENLNQGMIELLRTNANDYRNRLNDVSIKVSQKIQAQDPLVFSAKKQGRKKDIQTAKGIKSQHLKSSDVGRILSESQRVIDNKNQELRAFSERIGDKELELEQLKSEIKALQVKVNEHREYRVFDFERSFRMSGWVNTGTQHFASYELGPKGIGPRGLEYIKVEFLTPRDDFREEPIRIMIYDDTGKERVTYENRVKGRWAYCEVPINTELKQGTYFIKVKIGGNLLFNRRFLIEKSVRS